MALVHGLEHEMAQNKQDIPGDRHTWGAGQCLKKVPRDSLAMELFDLLDQVVEDPEVK